MLARRLKSKFDVHLSRKFFHVLVGTIVANLFVSTLSRLQTVVGLMLALIILMPLEFLRFRFAAVNRLALRVYGSLMRESERSQVSGQLYYAVGLSFCLVLLPRAVAIQAVLTLAWMDPVAGLFGVRYGRRRWNSVLKVFLSDGRSLPLSLGAKTLEGSFAGFIAAFLAGLVAWTGSWAAVSGPQGLWWPSPGLIFVLSSVGGLTAVIAEAWPSQWDDNTLIPFWSGLMVWGTAQMLGVPLNFY